MCRLLDGQITYAREENGHKIYNIVCKEEEQENEAKENFKLFSIGRSHLPDSPLSKRCVLLLGETGAGKTTFINAVLNYLFGVKFDDPVRLQIEEKVEDGRKEIDSRTNEIKVYTVHYQEGMKHKFNFVLIDTPGLADTRGTEQQQVFMQRLETLLTSDFGVDDLHCLGIVAKGNTNRILGYQKELLGEIKSVLGKHIPHITNVFATFALESVTVDAVVRDSGISFKEMFKFDNGGLLCPRKAYVYDARRRLEGMTEQYDTLFDALIKAPPVSIAIIREKKFYDRCKKKFRDQKELLVGSLVTLHLNVETYKENYYIEQESRDWRTIEQNERIDTEELDGPHAHNCNVCNQTCWTCSSKMCSLSAFTVGGSVGAVLGAGASLVVEGIAVGIGVGFGAGIAAFGATFAGVQAVTAINGMFPCKYSDCQHPISHHVIKQTKKIKRYDIKEHIDDQKKKIHEKAVSTKSKADKISKEEKQKVESRCNNLSEYTKKLLFHGKRIHKLDEKGFDYMKDTEWYLDEPHGKECSTSVEKVTEKIVVHAIKEAMKHLDSCTEQDCDNHGFIVAQQLPVLVSNALTQY